MLRQSKRTLALVIAALFGGSAFATPSAVNFTFMADDRGAHVILGVKAEPNKLTVSPPVGERLVRQTTSFSQCYAEHCERIADVRTDKGEYVLVVQWPKG